MKKDDYKLGKILGTSVIISDVPLGSPKPKKTKLKLVILAVILGYVGFAVYSNTANAQKDEIIKFDTPSGVGELVNISLCKRAIKDGHFVGEADGEWHMLAYYYDRAVYIQTFYWGFDKQLTCRRWPEVGSN